MNSPYKMYGKSPMMKALIGGQKNLAKNGAPELQAAIEASPATMKKKSMARKGKMLATLTKTNKKTGETTVDNNPGSNLTEKEKLQKQSISNSFFVEPISNNKLKSIDANVKPGNTTEKPAASKMKKKSPAKKYKSDAQRKAVHASKSESPAKMYGKKSPAKNYKKGYYGA